MAAAAPPPPSSNNQSSTPSTQPAAPVPSAPPATPAAQTPPPPAAAPKPAPAAPAPAATPGLPPQLAPGAAAAAPLPPGTPVINVQVTPAQPGYPPQPQPYIVQQQQPQAYVAPANVHGCKNSAQITCPACRAVVSTRTETSFSTIDIILIIVGVFFVVFLFGFILVCFIAMCSPFSDIKHYCPRCNHFIGTA
uniref:LITAF domain-containing protein n=1 Tax=Panagrolaimus sp. ES5 TaxID=591445 RepID=A0AC34GU59_9BILA